ncbi:MAG: hypothetical protein J6Y85_04770 [Alphaproteobacteria bacterium]|nr:hypothetical protein [Alphaproteobacteria bacterium]
MEKEENVKQPEQPKEQPKTIDTWKMKAIDALSHGCTINCDGPDAA